MLQISTLLQRLLEPQNLSIFDYLRHILSCCAWSQGVVYMTVWAADTISSPIKLPPLILQWQERMILSTCSSSLLFRPINTPSEPLFQESVTPSASARHSQQAVSTSLPSFWRSSSQEKNSRCFSRVFGISAINLAGHFCSFAVPSNSSLYSVPAAAVSRRRLLHT